MPTPLIAHTNTHTHTQRARERERDGDGDGDRDRQTYIQTDRQRDRQRDRETDRETDRDTDRDTNTNRDTDRDTDTVRSHFGSRPYWALGVSTPLPWPTGALGSSGYIPLKPQFFTPVEGGCFAQTLPPHAPSRRSRS